MYFVTRNENMGHATTRNRSSLYAQNLVEERDVGKQTFRRRRRVCVKSINLSLRIASDVGKSETIFDTARIHIEES